MEEEKIHDYEQSEWIIDERGNQIHRTVVFGSNVTYGSNNYFGPYCIIGMPGEIAVGFPKDGAVAIGDNNVFAGAVTVDASRKDVLTIITDNCFLMKQTHVGHDVTMFENCRLAPHATIGGEVVLRANCNVGMNAVIHQQVEISEGCMIGMGAVVTKKTKLKPWRKYAGVPAKDIGSNEAFKP